MNDLGSMFSLDSLLREADLLLRITRGLKKLEGRKEAYYEFMEEIELGRLKTVDEIRNYAQERFENDNGQFEEQKIGHDETKKAFDELYLEWRTRVSDELRRDIFSAKR